MRKWFLGILVVSSLAASRAVAAPDRRVALDLSWAVENAEDAAQLQLLRERLVARLSQEGFTVVSGEDQPDLLLRLSSGDPGWVIRATLATETLTREVPRCGIRAAEDQLEIVQKATELVRRAHFRLLEAQSEPMPRSAGTARIAGADRVACAARAAPAALAVSGLAASGRRRGEVFNRARRGVGP